MDGDTNRGWHSCSPERLYRGTGDSALLDTRQLASVVPHGLPIHYCYIGSNSNFAHLDSGGPALLQPRAQRAA